MQGKGVSRLRIHNHLPPHEPHIRAAKVADVRQHQAQVRFAHAEPARQGGGELVDRGGRQQPAGADFVVVVQAHDRERAVVALAQHRSAEHEVVRSPAVVGTVAVAGQRAAEVRSGEGGHVVGHAEADGGVVEVRQRSAQLRVQAGLGG